MHFLSLFPHLLTYGLLAPMLLRISVGLLRLFAGIERYKKGHRISSILSIISSILIIIGLYTQIAAIAAIVLIFFDYYTEKKISHISKEKNALTILMIAILLSLLFTGPGFLAFDLPL